MPSAESVELGDGTVTWQQYLCTKGRRVPSNSFIQYKRPQGYSRSGSHGVIDLRLIALDSKRQACAR